MQINLFYDWQKEALCVNTVQLVTPVVWSFCPFWQKYTQLLCRVQAEQKVFQKICIASFASICLYFDLSTYLCTHAWTQITIGREKEINKEFFFLSQTEHIYSTTATPLNFQFDFQFYYINTSSPSQAVSPLLWSGSRGLRKISSYMATLIQWTFQLRWFLLWICLLPFPFAGPACGRASINYRGVCAGTQSWTCAHPHTQCKAHPGTWKRNQTMPKWHPCEHPQWSLVKLMSKRACWCSCPASIPKLSTSKPIT